MIIMFNEIEKRRSRAIPMFVSVEKPYEATGQHLAVTPADMHKMNDRGIPVSGQNESLFYDGDGNISMDIGIEYRRGIDVNDLWDAEQDSRKKVMSLRQKSVENTSLNKS